MKRKRNEFEEYGTRIEPNEEKIVDTVNKSIEILLFERAGEDIDLPRVLMVAVCV